MGSCPSSSPCLPPSSWPSSWLPSSLSSLTPRSASSVGSSVPSARPSSTSSTPSSDLLATPSETLPPLSTPYGGRDVRFLMLTSSACSTLPKRCTTPWAKFMSSDKITDKTEVTTNYSTKQGAF